MSARTHRLLRVVAGLALLAGAHLLLRGYVTDDTYIHLRYAQNVAAGQGFVFNPGEPSYGATSPLWIFGLVGLLELGLAGETAAWTLGLIAGVLTVLVWAWLLARLPFSERWRWWLLLMGLGDVWFLRWTMSGMETPLATVALLVLLVPVVLPVARPREGRPNPELVRRYLAWGVAAGLAGLVRPEFLLLGPLALPWLLWFEYRRADDAFGSNGRWAARPQRPLLAAAAGWLLATGPWFVHAWLAFGRLTPGTAAAKSQAVGLDPVGLLRYLALAAQPLAMTQGLLWAFLVALMGYVLWQRRLQSRALAAGEPASPSGLPLDGGLLREWSLWQAAVLVLIPLTWAAALLGGYALKRVWVISRYVSPLGPPLLLALAVLAFWLLRAAAPYRGRWQVRTRLARLVVAGVLLVNVALLVLAVRPHAVAFSAGVRECYLDLGRELGERTPPDGVIAALDIGALAYGSHRRVLDLMGLVSPEIMEVGRQMGFQEMVETGAWLRRGETGQVPTWFVDRSEGPPRWEGRAIRGVTFDLVQTCTIHGVGLREGQDWTVALYRLSPASSPPPSP